MKRILAAALLALLALLAGCTGSEEAVAPEEEVVVVVEEDPSKWISGVERKRLRDGHEEMAKGFRLLWGLDGVHDPRKAHEHLMRAAKLGNERAQGIVGVNYEKGRGVERNQEEAVVWWKLAADGGWPHAQLKLGEAYRDGRGVEADPVEALKWLALSGRGGSVAGKMIATSYASSLPREQRQEGLERVRAWRIEHGLPVRERPAGAEPVAPDAGA